MSVRPKLNSIPIPNGLQPGGLYVTCSPGQWDGLLKASYEKGFTLLEIEVVKGEEKIVRAWKKEESK
jgi:hypothetical protein